MFAYHKCQFGYLCYMYLSRKLTRVLTWGRMKTRSVKHENKALSEGFEWKLTASVPVLAWLWQHLRTRLSEYFLTSFSRLALVSRGQTTISAQGVIACSISARALILQAITPCAEIVVWPRETSLAYGGRILEDVEEFLSKIVSRILYAWIAIASIVLV